MHLSEEQSKFVEIAQKGKNILVDACIGSGKTTAIQALCKELPRDKKILYLTYNKLLKIDAKSKIHEKNVLVTNYHGFAYMSLVRMGVKAGISDLIQKFINTRPNIAPYDVLIIDEYQDIELELAELLKMVKDANPKMQIIAVGDMQQKIYDKTTLKVSEFINEFLNDYVLLEFTRCFRLSSELAARLGRIWNKPIIGVNSECRVERMNIRSGGRVFWHGESQRIFFAWDHEMGICPKHLTDWKRNILQFITKQRYMQVFQIRILWDQQNLKKTLQYLQHMIAVRD